MIWQYVKQQKVLHLKNGLKKIGVMLKQVSLVVGLVRMIKEKAILLADLKR